LKRKDGFIAIDFWVVLEVYCPKFGARLRTKSPVSTRELRRNAAGFVEENGTLHGGPLSFRHCGVEEKREIPVYEPLFKLRWRS
jgi:hypothetical protein